MKVASGAKEKEDAVKVLVTEELSGAGLALLREHFEVEERLGLKTEELKAALKDATAVIVRSKTQLTGHVLDGSTLKVIGRAGVGYDNIDLEAASRNGILVMNVPDGSTVSACEHTFALLLSLVRRIPEASASMREGKWRRDLMGNELFGKTLGVIGLGKIGAEVAKRARAFEMKVIGYDPYLPKERAEDMGITLMAVKELLAQADVITLHVPLTEATRKMIGPREFEAMKPTAYIINCARGPLIVEEALATALEAARIAGAAVDVYSVEPPDFGMALLSRGLGNLITTPHLGASTAEAQEKVATIIAQQVTRALIDEDFLNSVNLPRISKEMMEKVRPWIRLAEKLASFGIQLQQGLPGEMELAFEGDVARLDAEFISLGALKGFLEQVVEGQVTYVNAPILARDKGIQLAQVKRQATGNYKSALVLSSPGAGGLVLGGAVSPQAEPRLVQINEFRLDFPLDGRFLVVEHHDQPGAVGRVGTVLGNSHINIDRMEVCRKGQHQSAMMIITVDEAVPERVMDNLRELDDVQRVTAIELGRA
jgi:D-3-phosphoglycerate dehydrogenase